MRELVVGRSNRGEGKSEFPSPPPNIRSGEGSDFCLLVSLWQETRECVCVGEGCSAAFFKGTIELFFKWQISSSYPQFSFLKTTFIPPLLQIPPVKKETLYDMCEPGGIISVEIACSEPYMTHNYIGDRRQSPPG